MDAKSLVINIGPCTKDVNDCEILRALIVHSNNPGNIRDELAKAACRICLECYLPKIETL